MHAIRKSRTVVAVGLTAALMISTPSSFAAGGAEGGGGGDSADTGSTYSDLVVAYRDADGTPILKEYLVDSDEDGVGDTVEYCVQPASYARVPGLSPVENPLDGADVYVIPLQGEWIGDPEAPDAEIEACDPQPQYAMFVAETELERLNLTRTTDDVLTRKIDDVRTKLLLADEITLDPAGRLATDGAALDAAPEYAGIYQSLMTTGTIPGLPDGMAGPPAAVPAGSAGTYGPYELGAVAIGTAAGKYVPITVDTIQYYNRVVFTLLDPAPSWPGMYPLIRSTDPDPATPMPTTVLPGKDKFVDYSELDNEFSYNRSETFVGAVTWLNVLDMEWVVEPILDAVVFTDITDEPVGTRTLTGLTAFAQMADDVRSVIVFLHENEVVLPGFYMDPVGVNTIEEQRAATTNPAVDFTSLPTEVFKTMPFQVTASLFNPWGGELVDEGRVRVTVDAPEDDLTPADLSVSSQVEGVEVPVPFTVINDGDGDGDGDLQGLWGPDTGFEVPKGYHESATFDVTLADTAPAGDYQLKLELFDIDDTATALATDSATMGVNDNMLTLLWGGEVSSLQTQGSFIPLSLRVYSPTDTLAEPAELTFSLSGPPEDPLSPVAEALAAGDATVYGDDGTDMVSMDLTLDGGSLVGTWGASLLQGFNDVTWYLNISETAPIGAYTLDVGVSDGIDLAEQVSFSLAAVPIHNQKPPGVGDDTTDPVVTLSLDGVLSGTASFTIAVNEPTSALKCQLTSSGVAGAWEDCATGARSYSDLVPGDYLLTVTATDVADNTATYAMYFTVATDAPPATEDPEPIKALLRLLQGARGSDTAKVIAPPAAAGATVKLFKVRKDGSVVRPALAVKKAGAKGNARFVVKDLRKQRMTTYVALVGPTDDTLRDWTPRRSIR